VYLFVMFKGKGQKITVKEENDVMSIATPSSEGCLVMLVTSYWHQTADVKGVTSISPESVGS